MASFGDVEVLTYRDLPTCGAGWVEGARAASCDYICFAADDLEAHPGFFDFMVEAVDLDKHPAATVLWGDGQLQSCGGRGNDVCGLGCADWTPVEWSPTPFIRFDWWWHVLEEHASTLARLHYSSDVFVSELLAREGIPSVMRGPATLTHHNHPLGRDHSRAGPDGQLARAYLSQLPV